MNSEDCFDEHKARNLVDILLKNDISIYRKLLPEVHKLDSESFENLFGGADDYDFQVKNKKLFNKLSIKFNNFQVILEEWYKDSKYYEYLKELWSKYPCIENLRDKDDKSFEEILNSYKINYSKWPLDIKYEFKTLVSNTQDTRAYELKNLIEDKFSQLNNVLEELIVFRNAIKKQGEDNAIYVKNSQNIIMNIIQTIVLPIGGYFGKKSIEEKEIKEAHRLISSKCLNKKEADYIAKDFMKIIKKKKCTGCYNYIDKNKKLHKLRINCKDGKIDNLSIFKKAKAFFKCKVVCGLHAALSFLNLGWSVYELTQTYKGFSQIKEYKIRLEEIVNLFNIHKKEIGILPEDFSEAAQRIKTTLDTIRQDQQKLRQLMQDIRKSIKIQEGQKNKSIAGLITSAALGVFGVAGSIITCNGVSLVYGISSVANVFSAISHTTNIVMANKIIDGFNEILDEAIKEEQIIQDEIDKLIKELMERLQQEPKFDLNTSISSISTQYD